MYIIRGSIKQFQRRIVKWYDQSISKFYPYIWRTVQLEFVPQHVVFTGGIKPHDDKKKQIYLKRIADAMATGYDCGIDIFTLHIPYALWSYEDVSALSGFMNLAFKRLNFRPFISFVQRDVDNQLLIDNSAEEHEELFGKNVTILVLSPTSIPSKLQSAQLVVQLLDQRHSNVNFVDQFDPNTTPQQLFQKLPGLSPDSTGIFSRQPDLIVNFGGDYNETVQNIPFWLLRKAQIRNFGSLKGFCVNSFVRIVRWFDRVQAFKMSVVEGRE
ncbi:Conserved_hypothetical protein [Hexamita inflata]|uniref:Uncharacterized protein n=1 Tax=Hexamita inflata TaxID=28002 RepID=A0AA86QZM8_9EUKA|nr:Conserved hypothetical protein [Hexamita inflata]CAI9943410.1 Conserved hypothetical protein [Hexamita inflata]CAI9968999.1 Conserved hypothetical protein [Hexamita inflata]CAI9973142.1 Conserved hypothetical protein [Hexamita inflata]